MSRRRKAYLTVNPEPEPAPEGAKREHVQLGDIVSRHPCIFLDDKDRCLPARVIYIHPLGRFHTVQFLEGGYRESYFGVAK